MRRRFKMKKAQSRRNFKRGTGVHRKNVQGAIGGTVMRGGIRL